MFKGKTNRHLKEADEIRRRGKKNKWLFAVMVGVRERSLIFFLGGILTPQNLSFLHSFRRPRDQNKRGLLNQNAAVAASVVSPLKAVTSRPDITTSSSVYFRMLVIALFVVLDLAFVNLLRFLKYRNTTN